jgi:hypothetical protein
MAEKRVLESTTILGKVFVSLFKKLTRYLVTSLFKIHRIQSGLFQLFFQIFLDHQSDGRSNDLTSAFEGSHFYLTIKIFKEVSRYFN